MYPKQFPVYCKRCSEFAAYIEKLETELEEQRELTNKLTGLMMDGEALRHKTMMHAIMAGAYDNLKGKSNG